MVFKLTNFLVVIPAKKGGCHASKSIPAFFCLIDYCNDSSQLTEMIMVQQITSNGDKL